MQYLDNEIMYANSHYLSRIDVKQIGYYKFPEVIKSVDPDEGADFLVEKIHFQVDDKGALWDILTNSIYTHEFDYIRELIQNAIDATLLKYYVHDSKIIEYVSPRSWNTIDTITVLYSESKNTLLVHDQGIGMDESEIRNYLFKAADSGYKYKKKRKEFEFPSIAKFGIGFVACLTKASYIEIVSQAKDSNQIKAEIEEKSTIAFIERRIGNDKAGTLIRMTVKNKFSFNELKDYIHENFCYPSIKMQLIDVDKLCEVNNKINYLNIDDNFLDSYEATNMIIYEIKNINEKKNLQISKYIQDKLLINKITTFLDDDRNINEIIKWLKITLSVVTHNSIIKNRLDTFIENENYNINGLQYLRNIVRISKNDIDDLLSEYPIFFYNINNSKIKSITDYEVLVLQLDESFNIKQILRDNLNQKCRGRGIVYVRTHIYEPSLGIEWQVVNSFLYNSREICKYLLKVSPDEDSSHSNNDIISLDEIGDFSYEINLKFEEENNEDYYESVIRCENEAQYSYKSDRYDVVYTKKNDFYVINEVEPESVESAVLNDDSTYKERLLANIMVPDEYKGEDYQIGISRLYQDGILMTLDPQIFIPLGSGWSVCNLTADARFELNASRHEINMNRSAVDSWLESNGKLIQKKVVMNCIGVFKQLDLDYSIEKLMSVDVQNEYIAKQSYNNMKSILKEIISSLNN